MSDTIPRPEGEPWADLPFAAEAEALADRYAEAWPENRRVRVLQHALMLAFAQGQSAVATRALKAVGAAAASAVGVSASDAVGAAGGAQGAGERL